MTTATELDPVGRIKALCYPLDDGPFGWTFAEMRDPDFAGGERFNPKQPRWPKGSPGGKGGKWAKLGDVAQAIANLLAGGEDEDSPMVQQLKALEQAVLAFEADGGDNSTPAAPKAKPAPKPMTDFGAIMAADLGTTPFSPPSKKKPKAKKVKPVAPPGDDAFLEHLQAIEQAIVDGGKGDDKTATSVQGATLEPGGVYTTVKYHGVDIGHMGPNASDGSWTVFVPTNSTVEHTPTGISSKSEKAWPITAAGVDPAFAGHTVPTKDEAVQVLVDSYNTHVLGQAVLTGQVPSVASKKKVALVPAGNDLAVPSYASSPEAVMVGGEPQGYVYQDADSGKWAALGMGGGWEVSGLDSKLDAVQMVTIQSGGSHKGGVSDLDFSGVKDAPASPPLGPPDLLSTTHLAVTLTKNGPWEVSVHFAGEGIGTVHANGNGTWLASNYPGLDPDDPDSVTEHATKNEAISALIEHHNDSITAGLPAPFGPGGGSGPLHTAVPGASLTHASMQTGELLVHYDDGGSSVAVGMIQPSGDGWQTYALAGGGSAGFWIDKDDAVKALVLKHKTSGAASDLQTSVPGVTLAQGWPTGSLDVTYGPTSIGKVEPNNLGKWSAHFPGGVLITPMHDTKDDAVKALVDGHLASIGMGPISTATAAIIDSDLQTAVAGIALAHTGQDGHLSVTYGGKNIGTIYHSPVGTWVGYLPGSGIGTSEPNKDDAIELLLTDYLLNNPGAAPKKTAPKLPKGKPVTVTEGIGHVKEDTRKLIFSQYKAQLTGQLISSPAADNFDNLFALGYIHGLTPAQVADVVDDQWSKNWHAGNSGVLAKKIRDWLKTPEGAAYAKAHKKPKAELVLKMTGKDAKTPKGVKLKPGQKVQKVSGPGGYKPGDTTHYKKIDSKAMQASQQAYMDAHGVKLTPEQMSAMQSYTAGGYSSMNGYLRGTHTTVGPETKQHTVQLQSAMMPLQESILLLRGAGWEHFPEEFRGPTKSKGLKGKSVVWPEFVSTSVAGSGGAFSGAVSFEIEAPAGTHGLFVRPWSIHKSENELVLPAGTKFRIMAVTPPASGAYGPTVVRMRVVTPK